MFELRWLEYGETICIKRGFTEVTLNKKLQYRTQIEVTTPDGIELYWSEWTDVPTVKELTHD